jgi:peptidylprolyl isomerase
MLAKVFLTICVVAALALAGCGGDDETTSAGGTDTSAAAEAPESTETAPETTEATQESTEAGPESIKKKPTVEVPSGAPPKQLGVEEMIEGTGPAAKAGDVVTVNYVGVNYENGKEFDTSWGRGPFTFKLGAEEVIPGWDQGVPGIKVGGRRKLIIPPELAYGEEGFPPGIPPNETLVFVVDMVKVK